MHFDIASLDIKSLNIGFCLGSAWPILTVILVYLVANRLRHKCKKQGCKCTKTGTHYRLLHLRNHSTTRSGFQVHAVFKFRKCSNGHVTVSMKTKMFSAEEIDLKPDVEFDWGSKFINDLCEKADIKNPSTDYFVEQYSSPNPTPRIAVIHPTTGHDWPVSQKDKSK